METKTLEKVRSLKGAANETRNFWKKYWEIKAVPSNDKIGAGFNQDDRFAAFKISLSFDSWCGVYGNSSCGKIFHCDGEIARKHFVAAINKNCELLFKEAAESMMKEAVELHTAATKELADLQSLLDSVDQHEPIEEPAAA